MRKIIPFIMAAFTITISGNAVTVTKSDDYSYIENEIRRLESELKNKQEKLNKCADKNKNFKVAGIATVGLSVAGVATNVALANKQKEQESKIKNMTNTIRTAESIDEDFNILSDNADEAKLKECLDQKMTTEEKKYLVNNIQHLKNIESLGELNETDKDFVIKYMQCVRESQK